MTKKKKSSFKKYILGTLVILLCLVLGTGYYVYNLLNQVATGPIIDSNEELGIKEDNKTPKVTNIALFGLDRRNPNENSRSDSIMIATLDLNTKKIKLTSIMRDTYVNIPGRGMDKINHAYAFGGPQLALKTINENFDMNIRDYVMVDFFGLMDIVDDLGGIEIDIKDYEVSRAKVSGTGVQTLNGEQALAYSRIRYAGNGDYERTERQRVVLEQIMNKIMGAGAMQYPKMISKLLPHVETSLTKPEMLKLGTSAFTHGVRSIDQYRIPVDGYAKGQKMNGVYYLVPQDLAANVNFLHEYIYEKDGIEVKN
ncbi:LCP family protein [Irregularibacter muris]|uniref:LCP family protein n=1 Tax=Irregularibacter muris TaxID=1796619 RepID=A0AAE3KZA4_9FIRM|nr:LCP family protein [Irregularibacter muris]MCR1898411.1 LCP family protein [Irregularibacter muris]